MTTETTKIDTDSTTDPLASLLAIVDLSAVNPTPDKPKDMTELSGLSPAWRGEIETAGRKAFFTAIGEGSSEAEALDVGKAAAGAKYDELVARAEEPGPDTDRMPIAPTPIEEAAPASPAASSRRRGIDIDEAGRARSEADVAALRASGFAPRETLFDRGTTVVDVGVENARAARLSYEKLPLVNDGCADLISKIDAENRRIYEVQAGDISMLPDGQLTLGSYRIDVTEHGFSGMCERLGYGGAAYLSRCAPPLRAHNVEAQRMVIASSEIAARAAAYAAGDKPRDPKVLAARIRDRAPNAEAKDPGGEEVFAFVSPGYAAFDADKIAEAFARAMPSDARGSIRYDSATTGLRAEALFHTTVAPEDFVCGEVFRTGIRVRASDSGDGSIIVRAIAFQNLCLNLIIIDRMGREIARIRHTGSVEALAKAFESALTKATRAIAPFMRQWGYACREDVGARLRDSGTKVPQDREELIRGIFAGILAKKLVKLPRLAGVGKAKLIDELAASWVADDSGATRAHGGVTRAAVVNAFTRTAQKWIVAADPWATDAIELDAAKLLWGDGDGQPAPLPFVDLAAVDLDAIATA